MILFLGDNAYEDGLEEEMDTELKEYHQAELESMEGNYYEGEVENDNPTPEDIISKMEEE